MKIRCIKNSLGIYTTFKYSTFLAKLALCDEEGLDVRNLVGYIYIHTLAIIMHSYVSLFEIH